MAENNTNNEAGEKKEKDDFVFLREEIKSRPISRKKLFKNTASVVLSALSFGIIACITFALLTPVFTKWINRDDENSETTPQQVVFPEETEEEEMTPEDMLVETDETEEIDYSQFAVMEEEEIEKIISSISFTVSDYQDLYKSLAAIAENELKAMVQVTAVTKDTNWINELYEGTTVTAGLIVADNDTDLFIVTYYDDIKKAEEILVTFSNDIQAEARFVDYDSESGFCVLAVPDESISEAARESIEVATLGFSYSRSLVGSPIIAVGSPMGSYGTVNYGIVTGNSTAITVVDNNYKRLTTDIYGSQHATGVLINLKGEVIGLIDTKFASGDTSNLIGAIGISEIKKPLEDIINGAARPYVGITGADVPSSATSQEGAPNGTFVLSVEFDSPAMNAGIQSGDIIVSYGNAGVSKYSDLVSAIRAVGMEEEIPVVLYRKVQDEYKEIDLTVTPSQK